MQLTDFKDNIYIDFQIQLIHVYMCMIYCTHLCVLMRVQCTCKCAMAPFGNLKQCILSGGV